MAGIAVLGTGAWGTALARLVALERIRSAQSLPGGLDDVGGVTLWEHRAERAVEMQWERVNRTYLPGFPLPANLRVTSDLADAVRGHDVLLLVTPSQQVRENARLLAPLVAPGAVVVCGSKGLEIGTHLRLTQVMEQVLP
ncbi:MAG: hypothetical protein ACRDHP_20585, partial [Ktedonobacterales bacterium]